MLALIDGSYGIQVAGAQCNTGLNGMCYCRSYSNVVVLHTLVVLARIANRRDSAYCAAAESCAMSLPGR